MGYRRNHDFAQETEGVGLNDVNAFSGRRCNMTCYLKRAGVYPESGEVTKSNGNLRVDIHAHVHRILFEGNKAVGVEAKINGEMERIRVKKEIVLSTGTVNSPQILMLSGNITSNGPYPHVMLSV